MEPKKISFGFSKITKKPNLLPINAAKPEPEIELIKCVEGQEIMLVEERQETAPIVIPMKESGKTSAALASLMKRRAVLLGEDEESSLINSNQDKSKSGEVDSAANVIIDDLEKRAAHEILLDLQKTYEAVRDSGLVLPDELPLDGAKESKLDDYESIPIEQYGLAMLRGMGWVEPPPSKQRKLEDEAPIVRPKGMGLGADKALKPKPLLVQPESNETLEIKKQAFVRILGGKFKDAYGQIEGFDDEAGRVIVKLAIGGSREAFNEFLCQPISKKEYTQYGKCINTAKYEEYKKLENEHGQIVLKQEVPLKPKTETKPEKKEEKQFSRKERDTKIPSYQSSGKYDVSEKTSSRQRYDNHSSSSSNRRRMRSRTRSTSCSRKYSSSKKYNDEKYSDDKSVSTTNESDTDSAYEQRHKHRSKSKSSKEKSKKSKKKSKHHRTSSGDDSSYGYEGGRERQKQRDHRSSKKIKKIKKSKKKRSRTPKK